GAVLIDRDDVTIAVERHGLDRAFRREHAGAAAHARIGETDIETAVFLRGPADRGFEPVELRDIDLDAVDRVTETAQPRHLARHRAAVAVENGDGAAMLGDHLGHGEAKPRRAAGDDAGLAGHVEHVVGFHASLPRPRSIHRGKTRALFFFARYPTFAGNRGEVHERNHHRARRPYRHSRARPRPRHEILRCAGVQAPQA